MPRHRRLLSLALILALAGAAPARAQAPEPGPDLRAAATRLIDEAQRSHDAYDGLSDLCDHIGNRLSGTPQLDSAIAWAAARMRAEGLQNVHTEKVMVPVWVRGRESAEMLTPRVHPLHLLGLGMSVGTPRGGITADVVVVDSFPQLDSLGAAGLRGRIVLYDVPFKSYGETVRYRGSGPSRAARYGAVAVFVRSISPVSLGTPHTGSLGYVDSLPKIPAAALTLEDATLIHRLCARGERVRVHLEMEAHRLPDAPSANVVGEVTGRERPDEVVAIGGHLDSWDVGQGAQDDGVGVTISMEAAHLMQRLHLIPRRTVRVVLWVNEENGSRGGRGYRNAHRAEVDRHVAMLESDIGNGLVKRFSLEVKPWAAPGDTAARDTAGKAQADLDRDAAAAVVRAIAALLAPIGPMDVAPGGGGTDVGPMAALGVPAVGLEHDSTRYFDVHHTEADTFDKIDPVALAKNVATMAVMAYAIADWPDRLRPLPGRGWLPRDVQGMGSNARGRDAERRARAPRWHALAACAAWWAGALLLVARFPQVERAGIRVTLVSVRAALLALGRRVEVIGNTLSVGGTSLNIGSDCSPHLPYLIFAGGVLALPATWRQRAVGLLVGALAIHVFNVVRILTLFAVRAARPDWFEFVHVYLWQVGTIVAVVAAFLAWLVWTGRPVRTA